MNITNITIKDGGNASTYDYAADIRNANAVIILCGIVAELQKKIDRWKEIQR